MLYFSPLINKQENENASTGKKGKYNQEICLGFENNWHIIYSQISGFFYQYFRMKNIVLINTRTFRLNKENTAIQKFKLMAAQL